MSLPSLSKIKFLTQTRKGNAADKKKFRGKTFRVNAKGLRGSSIFHDPRSPKIDMFINPDFKCVDVTAIGRYGSESNGKSYPLLLLRAAHSISSELYNNPLDYSLTRRVNKEGIARKIYSQRREAQAKVAATLVMHTHLEYGMVGKVGKNGKFYHMSLKDIASHAGIAIGRCKRVLRTFREKGALKVSQQYKKRADNTFQGHNSIRHLTKGFWAMFGFGKWMTSELKKRANARRDQTQGKPASKDTELLREKWEPKREKIMANMQRQALTDAFMKESRAYLES